ncbi:hypothetical protein F4802DRAFT_603492 [Xylaria palmicola]|nr:hypothetical protein F4802DRAFT_603492 [Xylaria palmicola]
MKSFLIIVTLFAAATLGAPVGNSADSDLFNYHNNINNAATVDSTESDVFNYHNNIDNAVTVTDADGTKVVLSSPYSDDVNAADAAKILGE